MRLWLRLTRPNAVLPLRERSIFAIRDLKMTYFGITHPYRQDPVTERTRQSPKIQEAKYAGLAGISLSMGPGGY